MKTFEEKWTAWLDGQLSGEDLAEFEAALPDKSSAEFEKQDALKLSAFLKQNMTAPVMGNEEFFHHQLRGLIEEETPVNAIEAERPRARESWWSIGRMLWTGAASLAIFCLCTYFVVREEPSAGQSGYLTQVITARVDPGVSPDANISIFETKENKVTVLWVNGLDTLPSEFAAK